MKRSKLSVWVFLTTILGAAALTALRYYQLARCMDAGGLLIRGSRVTWGYVGVSVLLIAALVLLIVKMDKTPGKEVHFHCGIGWNLLSAFAAAALMAGCGLCSLRTPMEDTVHLAVFTAGVLAGALLIISDALRIWGKSSNFLLLLIPTLFLGVRLIFDFKQWSTDPVVIDFCFRLLASVTTMLACFQLAGFPIGAAKKRTTVFFCMLSFVFSAITVSDWLLRKCATRELVVYAALGVWCLINGMILLFGQKEELPETDSTEEAQAE